MHLVECMIVNALGKRLLIMMMLKRTDYTASVFNKLTSKDRDKRGSYL